MNLILSVLFSSTYLFSWSYTTSTSLSPSGLSLLMYIKRNNLAGFSWRFLPAQTLQTLHKLHYYRNLSQGQQLRRDKQGDEPGSYCLPKDTLGHPRAGIPSTKNHMKLKWKCQSLSHVRLLTTPWTVTRQAPLFMGFSRQEYWSGSPFLSPGDRPDPGIKTRSPAFQADSLLSEPPGNP